MAHKKAKRYDDGGYTGDDPIVKYRMGMTDAAGNDTTKASSEEDTSMDREPNPTPTAVEKTTVKTKVSAPNTKPKTSQATETKTTAPTRQQKNAPKMFNDRNLAKSGTTGDDVKKALFGSSSNDSPRMKAARISDTMKNRDMAMKKGGKVKKMAHGGSASSRADGCITKGHTRGKVC